MEGIGWSSKKQDWSCADGRGFLLHGHQQALQLLQVLLLLHYHNSHYPISCANYVFFSSRLFRSLPFRLMTKDFVYSGPTGFVLPKTCTFVADFDAVIMSLLQGGIMKKIIFDDVSARQAHFCICTGCNHNSRVPPFSQKAIIDELKHAASVRLQESSSGDGERASKLELITMAGTFMFMAAILGAWCLVFLAERMLKRGSKTGRRSNRPQSSLNSINGDFPLRELYH